MISSVISCVSCCKGSQTTPSVLSGDFQHGSGRAEVGSRVINGETKTGIPHAATGPDHWVSSSGSPAASVVMHRIRGPCGRFSFMEWLAWLSIASLLRKITFRAPSNISKPFTRRGQRSIRIDFLTGYGSTCSIFPLSHFILTNGKQSDTR